MRIALLGVTVLVLAGILVFAWKTLEPDSGFYTIDPVLVLEHDKTSVTQLDVLNEAHAAEPRSELNATGETEPPPEFADRTAREGHVLLRGVAWVIDDEGRLLQSEDGSFVLSYFDPPGQWAGKRLAVDVTRGHWICELPQDSSFKAFDLTLAGRKVRAAREKGPIPLDAYVDLSGPFYPPSEVIVTGGDDAH